MENVLHIHDERDHDIRYNQQMRSEMIFRIVFESILFDESCIITEMTRSTVADEASRV